MKNLFVLSRDKPSNLCINGKNQQNIYITNSEDIKEGDIVKIPCGIGKVKELHWKYGDDNPSYIVEDIFVYKLRYGHKKGELQTNSFRYEDVKKIILTTDVDLIKDGVQAIDDEFLEWFVKNPSCEEVDTRKVANGVANHKLTYEYKIIIPKEETKQERIFDYNKKLESDCDDENFASGKIILQWNKDDQKQDTPLRICRMNLDLQYGNTAILRLEEIEELIKNLQIVRDRLL